MSSSLLIAPAVETGILADLKARVFGSLVRLKRTFVPEACSKSTWAGALPGVWTLIVVRPSIVASVHAVVLHAGSTELALGTSLTMTPTSLLQEIGFVSS